MNYNIEDKWNEMRWIDGTSGRVAGWNKWMKWLLDRWMKRPNGWMDGWIEIKKKVKETDQEMDGKLNYTHAWTFRKFNMSFFLEYKEDVHVLFIFNVCFFCKIAILSGNKHVLRGK